MRARCADGPYAGQTFEFPFPPTMRFTKKGPVAPLMWIVNGGDRHCYSLVENRHYSDFRLVYRDTF